MLRVKEDDAGAFEELVQRYQGRLLRLLEHMGPKRELADDMTQEVFLRVFRARKSYQPGAKFSTWLFTIAGNVARNAARSSGRRQEISEIDTSRTTSGSQAAVLSSLAVDSSGLMPTRVIEGEERAEIVRAAIHLLGDRQREALLLSKFEGLSYAEISEVMELSTKAVKSLLSRARVNLKDILAPYIDSGSQPSQPNP
ncbi:ECF RNA polymerase sigma-E factor [Roseimaritima multifibrata]|uniref:ECF RNA polymerase sigma-E factor n=2 Tax=Roseimaritima multifibrata TaxID=1930274 RepID=A0A517MAU1_9BACT|nr:ECF RNA polymerase sigma-E factor [Roseimaritima multifibrata]